MKVLKRDEQLKVEEIFYSLQHGIENKDKLLKELAGIINNLFKKSFTIRLILTKERKQSFVMSVIPETSTVEKIMRSVVSNDTKSSTIKSLWKKCNKWTIEIDERILSSEFTKEELTALFLHEVGHVVESDSIPKRISTVVQYSFASSTMDTKSVLKKRIFNSLLSIPIINSCMYQTSKDTIKNEVKADQYVVKTGYLPHLLSVMNKLESKEVGGKNATELMNFTTDTIDALKQRKAKLAKENLEELKNSLPDNVLKESVQMVEDTIFGQPKSKAYLEVVYENVSDSVNEIIEKSYMTEFFDFTKTKLKPILQNEVDYVQAKAQDIQSIDDKIMLISYINSKLDLIAYYKEIMANPKARKRYILQNTEPQLNRFEAQLLHTKKYIMNYKIPEKKNELVAWYPTGYEG